MVRGSVYFAYHIGVGLLSADSIFGWRYAYMLSEYSAEITGVRKADLFSDLGDLQVALAKKLHRLLGSDVREIVL